jgi:hypothetical protein
MRATASGQTGPGFWQIDSAGQEGMVPAGKAEAPWSDPSAAEPGGPASGR